MSHVGTLLFNPSRMSREDLEATLVGRNALADRLVKDMVADASGKTSRHWLVVAPRGFGKSHLAEVVAKRLQHDHQWQVARLPEEHYQVAHLADLLEQVVVRLDANETGLAKLQSQEAVEEKAVDWLRARRRDRGPMLVVVENFGDLLDKLSKRDAHRLREVLSRDAPFVLLATATGPSEGTTDHDAPFYDFFHTLYLEELSQAEVRDLVERHLVQDGVHEEAQRERVLGRIDALYHFAGGNPRLALALYGVLREGVSEALFEQMLQLLDRVTPYYQARLRDVSPQMARVLTEMSVASEKRALTPSEIATRLRLGVNQVTANISKLDKARFVRPAGRPNARSRRYEVVDRLFRIWMQMREDRSGRQQLRFLADFYEMFYENRNDAAWSFANDLAGRYWKSAPTDDGRAARNAWLTLEHLGKALRLGDGPIAARILDGHRTDRLTWQEIDGLQRRYDRCEDGGEKRVLALRIAEAADDLGYPEYAAPTVVDALRLGGWNADDALAIWGTFFIVALHPLGLVLERGGRHAERLKDLVEPPGHLPSARPVFRMQMAAGVPTLVKELSNARWGEDDELQMYREFLEAKSGTTGPRPVTVLVRAEWAMFCTFARMELGWFGDLAQDVIDRGYLGDLTGLSVLAQLRLGLVKEPQAVEDFAGWLAGKVPNWRALRWALTSGPFPWDTSMRNVYRLLRKTGVFPDPIEPFDAALRVEEAADPAAELEALHPELREAVEILLARNKSSEPALPVAAEPPPPAYGKKKRKH